MTTTTDSNVNHGIREHAICSASGASRWLKCPGSIYLSSKAQQQPPGQYAIEGTKAHELAEEVLRLWVDGRLPEPDADEEAALNAPNATMADYVLKYVRLCQREANKLADVKYSVETKLDFDKNLCMFGTVDFLATGMRHKGFEGLIVDFKYGTGVVVKAQGNPQVAYYAVALWRASKRALSSVRCIICQPRLADGVTEWTLRMDDLKAAEEEIKSAATKALLQLAVGNPTYTAGDHCIFCPGKSICPEQERIYGKKTM